VDFARPATWFIDRHQRSRTRGRLSYLSDHPRVSDYPNESDTTDVRPDACASNGNEEPF